jgi:hypothetical protein
MLFDFVLCHKAHLPAPPGEILTRSNGDPLGPDQSSKYRSGTGKIMLMMKWSRNEILNRDREPSRFMATPTSMHLKRLYRLMNYVIQTAEVGNYIKPIMTWDRKNRDMEFIIAGRRC